MRKNKAVSIGEITSQEYSGLIKQNYVTSDQDKMLKSYEEKNPGEAKEQKPLVITKALIWKYFQLAYKFNTKEAFEETPETLANVGVIINYFVKDPDFFKSPRLVKRVGNSTLIPDFRKGLLIIGNYGNGKTTIMQSLSQLFSHFELPMRYKSVNAHDIVTEYETLQTPGDKHLFYERYKCRALYVDDVKKEPVASNYGKKEIIRDIIEKRYDNRLKTYLTCNYREGDDTEDLSDGLYEFGERYGMHIYDRLFKMFNIIQFKGSSMRK